MLCPSRSFILGLRVVQTPAVAGLLRLKVLFMYSFFSPFFSTFMHTGSGSYASPHIAAGWIIFTCEDRLWLSEVCLKNKDSL